MSVGRLLLVGIGLLVVAGLEATASGTAQQRLPAPSDPKRLPNNSPRRLPARRVYEWRQSIVDEHGLTHAAAIYAPTNTSETAPWVVTAWYDAKRDAETIRVEFNAYVTRDADLNFAVLRNTAHNANRGEFRKGATQLWPDDKWNDRVVHRYDQTDTAGCFLVEVRIDDETIDFFHESLRHTRVEVIDASGTDAPAQTTQSPLDAEFKEYWGALAEIHAKREELAAADVPEAVKKELEKFLKQRERQVSAKHMGGSSANDYMEVRR